jgi:hypothetical protein
VDLRRLSCGKSRPVAALDGRIAIQIRDLDQTVIGNPSHDLIRLALSLATASRGSDLPGVTTARILEQVIEGYQAALQQDADAIEDAPKSIQLVMKNHSRVLGSISPMSVWKTRSPLFRWDRNSGRCQSLKGRPSTNYFKLRRCAILRRR